MRGSRLRPNPGGLSRLGEAYLSPSEIAARWACSIKTVMRRLQHVDRVRLGRHVRFTLEDVQEFEASGFISADEPHPRTRYRRVDGELMERLDSLAKRFGVR